MAVARGPPGDADGWEAAEAEAQPIPVPDPIDLLVLTSLTVGGYKAELKAGLR